MGFFGFLEPKQQIAIQTHVRHYLFWAKLNGHADLETYELVNEYLQKVEKPDDIKDLFPLNFEMQCELYSFIKKERKHLDAFQKLAKERKIRPKIKFLPKDQWIASESGPEKDPILDAE